MINKVFKTKNNHSYTLFHIFMARLLCCIFTLSTLSISTNVQATTSLHKPLYTTVASDPIPDPTELPEISDEEIRSILQFEQTFKADKNHPYANPDIAEVKVEYFVTTIIGSEPNAQYKIDQFNDFLSYTGGQNKDDIEYEMFYLGADNDFLKKIQFPLVPTLEEVQEKIPAFRDEQNLRSYTIDNSYFQQLHDKFRKNKLNRRPSSQLNDSNKPDNLSLEERLSQGDISLQSYHEKKAEVYYNTNWKVSKWALVAARFTVNGTIFGITAFNKVGTMASAIATGTSMGTLSALFQLYAKGFGEVLSTNIVSERLKSLVNNKFLKRDYSIQQKASSFVAAQSKFYISEFLFLVVGLGVGTVLGVEPYFPAVSSIASTAFYALISQGMTSTSFAKDYIPKIAKFAKEGNYHEAGRARFKLEILELAISMLWASATAAELFEIVPNGLPLGKIIFGVIAGIGSINHARLFLKEYDNNISTAVREGLVPWLKKTAHKIINPIACSLNLAKKKNPPSKK